MNEGNLHQEIFRVAYDIYERSGRIEGRDIAHWLEAERIVRTLRQIAGDDGGKLISVNIPTARSDEEGEYSNWMIKFFKR
jgi:replicative DNA helicase